MEPQVTDELIQQYEAKLKEAVAAAEEDEQRWKKYEDDYRTLQEFLNGTVAVTRRDVMVPLGPLAFMPGQLVHTNEVLVLLGDNWFAERSVKEAIDIIRRRRDVTGGKLNEAKKHLNDLRGRLRLVERGQLHSLEKSQLDEDGDEVNEEGLKFVDIREEYQEPSLKTTSEASAGASHSRDSYLEQGLVGSLDYDKLGPFEKKIFDRLKQLEQEEEQGLVETESDSEKSEDIEDDSEAEMRFEIMDDDDDDYNSSTTQGVSKIKSAIRREAEPSVTKHVRFSKEDISPRTSHPTASFSPMLTTEKKTSTDERKELAAPHRPTVSDSVVEKIDIDSASEGETDEFMFGRELLLEYSRRRNQLLQAEELPMPVYSEQEMEEVEPERHARVSRFRQMRQSIRENVELQGFPRQLAENPTQQPTVSRDEAEIPVDPSTRFKPNVSATRRVSNRGATTNGSDGPHRDVIGQHPNSSRISRFKAARLSASSPTADPKVQDADEDSDHDPDLDAPLVIRATEQPTRPPLVMRASDLKKVGPVSPTLATPSDTRGTAVTGAEPTVAPEQKLTERPKMSRFKARRLGLE
ncbi:uri1, prefoldin-like chaperone [Gaertneriomyces sp. JEL0708]|nr:uri1, prefoldin-like chaperone [Gaertneriomyces sp. JEL0708]